MSINTEAAELLHAVADLYECGALKWVVPEKANYREAESPVGVAIDDCSDERKDKEAARLMARKTAMGMTELGSFYEWQYTPDRNTRHVISLLRTAAQRLEQA